ncbi:spliceosome complex protein [Lactarius deliciosus]|nr:spliceosome complex protein [Lactarius deliciosus]
MAVALSASFPLTVPVPTPFTHPSLISIKDLHREEDLLRNPFSFRQWWSAINTTREAQNALVKLEPLSDISPETRSLLGPLSSLVARQSLQRLTYLYEAAIINFPGSFKLWKSYLQMRMSYVLGKQLIKKRAGGKRRLPDIKDALEEEQEDMEQWDGGLDGVVGWEEWKALIATFERALMWLPKLPRLWLMYLSIFDHPNCPPVLSHSHARRTYDRALRTLPPSLHHRIWVRYLLWAEARGGLTTVAVYRRYLVIDPSVTERYVALLLSPSNPSPRPLEAAKLLLLLSRMAARGEYISSEGKSPYQLLGDWLDVVEAHAEEVGIGIEELASIKSAEDAVNAGANGSQKQYNGNGLIRLAGPPTAVGADGKPSPVYDEDEDPNSLRKLDIEKIVREDGLAVYKDQAGRLWTGLATYWIKRGEFEHAKETFETGIATVLTYSRLHTIFDAYAEFSESVISALMEELADPDEEDEDFDAKETEEELDAKMKEFEELMDRRPFLVNDVLLRRNPNDVQEWEKRVAETYTQALSTIASRRATANFHRLYINFAKPDLASARKVLEKATKVNFKNVEDLAEIWCEWCEMEVRHENYDDAIRVMQRATAIPKDTKVNYHDHSLPVQVRLFKSLKLWSFYVDLEESLGTVESTKAVYDKILELRIANAQIIVNYAGFLEENKYFEECFKVYERGVELFTFPVSFEIWNIYLSKFVKRYGGSKLERARDLFEQALEKCPPKSCKPIFLLYAQLEEEHGLAKRAMTIYDRATQVVENEDKFEICAFAFAALERKLGEIDRARAIYAHASQFCDPRTNPEFWTEWHSFEIDTGSEDTFREMLRIKRSVQAQFNTEASYLAAQALAARQGAAKSAEEDVASDPMAAAERQLGGGKAGPSFVSAKQQAALKDGEDAPPQPASPQDVGNADEIRISDEDI